MGEKPRTLRVTALNGEFLCGGPFQGSAERKAPVAGRRSTVADLRPPLFGAPALRVRGDHTWGALVGAVPTTVPVSTVVGIEGNTPFVVRKNAGCHQRRNQRSCSLGAQQGCDQNQGAGQSDFHVHLLCDYSSGPACHRQRPMRTGQRASCWPVWYSGLPALVAACIVSSNKRCTTFNFPARHAPAAADI